MQGKNVKKKNTLESENNPTHIYIYIISGLFIQYKNNNYIIQNKFYFLFLFYIIGAITIVIIFYYKISKKIHTSFGKKKR